MTNLDHLKDIEIANLHPFEKWLLLQFRTRYRFGEITVIVQDGVPQRIVKAIIKDDPRDKNNIQNNDTEI